MSEKTGAGFIPVLLSSGKAVQSFPIREKSGKERNTAAVVESDSYMEISYLSGTTVRLRGEKDMELIKTLILLSR